MIARFGVTIVGARGTIGGITFSANKAGPYAKLWSRGGNPRSTLQNAHRNTLATHATGWRNLAQADRDDWDDYADDPAQELTNSLGETYFVSGFNWYVRINTHLSGAGAAARTAAPTLTRPVAPIQATLALFTDPPPTETRVFYNAGDPDLGELHTVNFSMFNSEGKIVAPNVMPLLLIEIPVAQFIVIQDEVLERFGVTSAGMRGFVSSRTQDAHGQRGPAAVSTDIAT